jgi:signal transduction histidine kinase
MIAPNLLQSGIWFALFYNEDQIRFQCFNKKTFSNSQKRGSDIMSNASYRKPICQNEELQRPNSELQVTRDRLETRLTECTAELLEAKKKLRLEIKAHRETSDQIRSLTHQLFKAQESERLTIARELHDSLAQNLIAAKMQCEYLLDIGLADPLQQEGKLKKVSDILSKVIADARNLACELRPPVLKQFGIVETLTRYCRDFSETHLIQVDFQATGFEKITIDDITAVNLYRIIQEGLLNIKKHADASQVSIQLFVSDAFISLRINDNGKGFNVRQRRATLASEKKLGLRSMQERIDLLQGDFRIDSKPGSGTNLFIKIPMSQQYGVRKENQIDC